MQKSIWFIVVFCFGCQFKYLEPSADAYWLPLESGDVYEHDFGLDYGSKDANYDMKLDFLQIDQAEKDESVEPDLFEEIDSKKEDQFLDEEKEDLDEYLVEDFVDVEIDTIENCPPGQVWNGLTCESFCGGDQYFDQISFQCLYFPAVDISGDWELKLMNVETLKFTYYKLEISQNSAVLTGLLVQISPVDTSECSGFLQKKKLDMTCVNDEYTLTFDNAVMNETEVNGFYQIVYADGEHLNGTYYLKKL